MIRAQGPVDGENDGEKDEEAELDEEHLAGSSAGSRRAVLGVPGFQAIGEEG